MSYRPGFLLTTHLAASTAPFAKMSLDVALCVISILSPVEAKITVCSPTTSPPLKAKTPISLSDLSPVKPSLP